MGWKEQRREQGYRDMLVWLTPEAVTALEALKSREPGASVADIISRSLVLASGSHASPGAGRPDEEHRSDVDELTERLAIVESRLARIDGGRREPAQKRESGGDESAFVHRRRRSKMDHAQLAEAVAERVMRDGWDFNVTELHRDLVAQGVKIHSQATNFWTWVKQHEAEVAEILERKQGTRKG